MIKPPSFVQVNVSYILEMLVKEKAVTNFLQIGSNDGKKNDPIRPLVEEFSIKGILVEPFGDNFNKLCENYAAWRHLLVFEQIGISDMKTDLDFYYVKDIQENEPDWYDQVGSFDKETFIKNIEVIPALLQRIGVKKISCDTVDNILERNYFSKIDLIHIDAEGYDFRILKSIDFNKWKPKAILFETDWMTQYELKEATRLFKNNGYNVYYEGIDCIALQNG